MNNAYEAVVRFRPEFLTRRSWRGVTDPSNAQAAVYVNGVWQGGADVLRSIPAAVIVEIKYLTTAAASDEFRTYHPGGALVVTIRP